MSRYNDYEFSSRPSVRSAWDAAKTEICYMAVNSGVLGANLVNTAINVGTGHPTLALFSAGACLLNVTLIVITASLARRKLKNIPAPHL